MKNRVFFWLLISILYIKNTNNGKPLVIMMVIKMVIMVNLGQISKAPPVTRRSSMTILYQIKNAMHAWLICLRHWIICLWIINILKMCTVVLTVRMSHVQTVHIVHFSLPSESWYVAQWLERFTRHQKVRLPSGARKQFSEFVIKLE